MSTIPALSQAKAAGPACCTLCGATGWKSVREGHDLCRAGSNFSFKLARCVSCGHIMQNPLPDAKQLSEAYAVDYAPYRAGNNGLQLWKILRDMTTWRRIRRLRRYGHGTKLLEIGCGAGDFLRQAHNSGWNVSAVEYSQSMATMIRDKFSLDVRCGELVSGMWPPDHFDVIALWSVLEHVPAPAETLAIAASCLRPGGIALMQIPTRAGVEAGRLFGEHWALLDLPRHLNFFDRRALAGLCSQAGLDLVLFRTPFLDTAWCYWTSAGNRIRSTPNLLQRAMWALMMSLLLPLFAPSMILRAWQGRGTEAFAMAVKR